MSSTPLVKALFPERFETTVHPRGTIRESIHARLSQPVNPLAEPDAQRYWTPAGPKVFARKEIEIRFENMPLILIRFGNERVIDRSPAGWDGYTRRELELMLEAYVIVDPSASAEEKLDEMSYYIEASMNGFKLDQFSTDVLIQETEYEPEFDAAQPVAVGRLMFSVIYLCPELGVDFGLWDRDGACIANNGLPVSQITVSSNFGDETFVQPFDDFSNDH